MHPWEAAGTRREDDVASAAPLIPPPAQGPHVTRPQGRSALRDYTHMLGVGAVGFTLDFGIFNGLLAIGWATAWANIVALIIAGLVTFKANLSLTFGHRRIPDPRLALVRFVLVTLVSILVIEAVVMLAAVRTSDVLALNAVKGLITVVAVGSRFVLYREWVFRHVPA